MRLPGTPHECRPLLELGSLSRQLGLGAPIVEGVGTIPVAQVVGTVQRGRDFDACWHPLHPRLRKLIDDIEAAQPQGLDQPIEVVRVDRAYFVRDGHKRMALALRNRREFIDANVSRSRSPYEFAPDTHEDAILRTARESEFRRHSGMAQAVPEARFALTEVEGYGELFHAARMHAYEMSERAGRLVAPPEAARDWYASVYLTTVADARSSTPGLLDSWTDADIFLANHRQRLAWWGSECDAPECAGDQLSAVRKLEAARSRSVVAGLFARARRQDRPQATLLPLADSEPDHFNESRE